MKQTPVRNGWPVRFVQSWITVAVLSTAFLSAGLTGCGNGVDSAEYKTILDQPETSPSDSVSGDSEATEATTVQSGTTSPGTISEAAAPSTQLDEGGVFGSDENGKPAPQPEKSDSNGELASQTPAEPPMPEDAPQPETSTGTAENVDQNAADPTLAETTTTSEKPSGKKQPREIKLLIPEKDFKTEGKGNEKALRVSFDDFDLLKVLNMEPVTEDAPSRMPKWLKDLDGKRIRVRGFMFPPFEEENIRAFTLARDNQICCFGRNPLVYDLVDVFMRKGEATDYIQNRPFDVIGVFHIGDSIVPGELYSMDDAVVIDR